MKILWYGQWYTYASKNLGSIRHIRAFNDPLVDCKQCKSRYRADEFSENYSSINWEETKCPGVVQLVVLLSLDNLIYFKTHVGPVEETGTEAF